jgi:hypothetical protein
MSRRPDNISVTVAVPLIDPGLVVDVPPGMDLYVRVYDVNGPTGLHVDKLGREYVLARYWRDGKLIRCEVVWPGKDTGNNT